MVVMSVVAPVAAPWPALAETVSGSVRVADGDSLVVDGRRVRLFGIDTPELGQTCDRSGESWACGRASADRLRALIDGHEVTCEGSEVDVYGRLLAVCSSGGVELNRAMVAGGWATAFRRYSSDYVAEEAAAREARSGLWGSSFAAPEDYRREQGVVPGRRARRTAASGSASPVTGACAIKGNRSRRGGRIYHLPGMAYYAQTRAEEMFCSEADAQAAGYRRARSG